MRSNDRLQASLDTIRERLFSSADAADRTEGALVTAFMSRIGGEGVTTITVGLARVLATTHSLRVLIVSYDAGKRGAAAALEIVPTVFRGFTREGDSPVPDPWVQPGEDGHLHVLTLDAKTAFGMTNDVRWSQALGRLRLAYDVVLVDSGARRSPLPARWSSTPHRAVLIIDTSRTTEEELQRLKAEFDSAGKLPDAVVLNKRDYHVPRFLYRYVR